MRKPIAKLLGALLRSLKPAPGGRHRVSGPVADRPTVHCQGALTMRLPLPRRVPQPPARPLPGEGIAYPHPDPVRAYVLSAQERRERFARRHQDTVEPTTEDLRRVLAGLRRMAVES